jgi:hypothetical protein
VLIKKLKSNNSLLDNAEVVWHIFNDDTKGGKRDKKDKEWKSNAKVSVHQKSRFGGKPHQFSHTARNVPAGSQFRLARPVGKPRR